MAHTASAKKRLRQTVKRTALNKSRKSRVRSYVRKVEEALASGNAEAAREALRAAEPELAKAAQKGVMHRNAASRKVARLSKRLNALPGA